VKALAAAFAMLFPFVALAEACPHLEYAELKDMKKEELQAKYCELKQYQASKKRDADQAASSGQLISLQILQYSFQCETEAKRVAEIMDRTYSAPPAACAALDAAASDSQSP
jgi:hypothetical protein